MFYGHLLDQNLMERRTSRRKRVWLVYDVQLKPFALKWRRLFFNILFKNFYDQILEFSNVFLHKIFKFSRTKIACLQKILLEEQNNVPKHHNFKEALKFLFFSIFSEIFSKKKFKAFVKDEKHLEKQQFAAMPRFTFLSHTHKTDLIARKFLRSKNFLWQIVYSSNIKNGVLWL